MPFVENTSTLNLSCKKFLIKYVGFVIFLGLFTKLILPVISVFFFTEIQRFHIIQKKIFFYILKTNKFCSFKTDI